MRTLPLRLALAAIPPDSDGNRRGMARLGESLALIGAAALASACIAAAPALAQPEILTTSTGGSASSPAVLFQQFYRASAAASRAAGHQVRFETRRDAYPEAAPSLGNAATAASDALVAISTRPGGALLLKQIDAVSIALGPNLAITLRGDRMTVVIAPTQGAAGAPTSDAIARAVIQQSSRIS
jgi:hypothetical protein